MIFHDFNNILFVLNYFPLLMLFLDYFPFFHVKSRQCGIHNNILMNLLGLFTKDKVFKYLDTSVTSAELNNWQ